MYVWVVTIADRPPVVFDSEKAATNYVLMHLVRANGGQVAVGMCKTQIADGVIWRDPYDPDDDSTKTPERGYA